MKLWLTLVGLGVLWANSAQAQVSRLEPAQPRWGQTLTIVYDSAVASARFSAADEVYVCAKLTFPDHAENLTLRMAKAGGKQHRAELKLKEGVAEISVHFISLTEGWDEWAYTTAAVYRSDGQSARGAFVSKISSGRYLEFFKQETALYPDNYSAYRKKWETAALIDAKKAASEINADIRSLIRKPDSAELLYALSFGYLLTGREAESRNAIRRLAAEFAASPFAGLAVKDYEEQIANLSTGDRAEVARLKLEIIRANPASDFARSAMEALAADSKAPLDLIESISGYWQKAEPENPLPNFYLAVACLNRYQSYGQVRPSLERAIELLLAGKLRLHGDINGKQSEAMLPEAYRMSADLAFRQQRFDDALVAVETAKAFQRENDFGPYLLQAKIMQAIGKNTYAETAFIEAWRRGSSEAEERLKDVYKGRRGSLTGFDEYLLAATKDKKIAGWRQVAPLAKLTTLDGKRYELNALTGKVVVINLWFIGCSPCRKEIPRLNELVKEFSGKPIVFLAPSFDSAETLRDFLKTTPFGYQVVPNAEQIISGQFNASAFPTHIVIDQNGFVEATLVGASERRPEEVRRLILRLLNAPTK
ncbi:MAG: TlpA disulfide reductase family protein [Acidobacteriota bacterium]|nr:TlpA disulfide reductase family protein [Acidobacteriota bacterium]